MRLKNRKSRTMAARRRRKPNRLRGTPLNVSAAPMERYHGSLRALVRQMAKATMAALLPGRTMDETSGSTLAALLKRFERMFEKQAPKIIDDMLKGVDRNSAQQVSRSLTEISGGLKIKPNADVADRLIEAASENVALIKTIPEQYFDRVTQAVVESQTKGTDLAAELQKIAGITERRARFIADDQTRKVFNSLNAKRAMKAGVRKGEWIHSGGGLHPREAHMDFDGEEFDLEQGAPIGDDGGYVMPGEDPNCRCTFRLILNFGDDE